MTPAEFSQFLDNNQKMKTLCIAFGSYFYRDLYDLAEKVYNVMDGLRESEYNCLPKKSKRTSIIHAIRKKIAGQRRKIPRVEMSNEPLLNDSKYNGIFYFYSMSQEPLFKILRGRYSVSLASQKKITVNDKVRVAGLLITKAPLHEYLPDLTGRSRGGDWQALDASQS